MAPSRSETHWLALTAGEVRDCVAAGATALWPVGATEQHGPHLATGFDHLAAQAVVDAAAARVAPRAIVLPTLAIGASRHWTALGATLSLSQQTLLAVLIDVSHSVAAAGLTRLMIVNGHMGNVATGMTAVAEDLGAVDVEFVSYWDLIDRELLAAGLRHDIGVGHAGEFETSIALHLERLVREDAIPASPAGGAWPGRPFDGPATHRSVRADDTVAGVVGDPTAATATLGAALIESAVAALVRHIEGWEGHTPRSSGGANAERMLVQHSPHREDT